MSIRITPYKHHQDSTIRETQLKAGIIFSDGAANRFGTHVAKYKSMHILVGDVVLPASPHLHSQARSIIVWGSMTQVGVSYDSMSK